MSAPSGSIDRVLSGRIWEDFCDRLKAAGQVILRPETPLTELDRAEGWRYLSRLARVGLEMMLENSDPDFPSFYMASHATAKIGADNPDNIYLNATITGDRDYRLRGSRGTVPSLSFGSKANRYAIDGTMASTGEIQSHALECGSDGNFEVIASANPHPGNWLPLAPDSSMILVRQTFLDRPREKPASVSIERIGGPLRPAPLTAERLERNLAATAAFVHGTARTFADWTQMFRAKPNTLETLDQSLFYKTGGDPRIFYLHGYWALAQEEALVIDTPVPECEIWNIQLNNYWMESLDYRYLPITVNKHTARYNTDGSATFVVAAEDRGVGNFLCTAGHETGTMLLRWTGAKAHPIPKCRVVKLDASMKGGGE
jgi:Protein of unknown function (DUF1214)